MQVLPLTFDFLSADIYKGGNISPGLNNEIQGFKQIYRTNYHLFHQPIIITFPGRNTTDAITAGVITGVTYEINEYIRTFEKKHTDFKIILDRRRQRIP